MSEYKSIRLSFRQQLAAPPPALNFDRSDPWSVSCWLRPDVLHVGWIAAKMDAGETGRGWGVTVRGRESPGPGESFGVIIRHNTQDRIWVVGPSGVLPVGETHHLVVTYDGSGSYRGVRAYIDGHEVELSHTGKPTVSGSIQTPSQFRVGGLEGGDASYRGDLDDLLIFDRDLSASQAESLFGNRSIPVGLLHSYLFDGNLRDSRGAAHLEPEGGNPSYVGPLSLGDGEWQTLTVSGEIRFRVLDDGSIELRSSSQ